DEWAHPITRVKRIAALHVRHTRRAAILDVDWLPLRISLGIGQDRVWLSWKRVECHATIWANWRAIDLRYTTQQPRCLVAMVHNRSHWARRIRLSLAECEPTKRDYCERQPHLIVIVKVPGTAT